VAVPGHSYVRTATRVCQSAADLFCHIAAPGGCPQEPPAIGGKRCAGRGKLSASAALAASGALPENVNYAVKSSLMLSFLESVPAVSAELKAPATVDRKFEDVVKSAQDAAVLVLVY
jgi:hypothetical protein